ncbi:Methyltransferase domain protein [Phycisphaerae bacterium RAS1]|nr:Methyltransferase domain protein [Phycisphaerae bacterium RAS1]
MLDLSVTESATTRTAAGAKTAAAPIDAAERMRHALALAARRGHRTAALLGAGRHTLRVLSALYDPPLRIAGFIDDRAEPGAHVCGWRVVRPAEAAALEATALILNSDACEVALWARRGEFETMGMEVFRLYPELDCTSGGNAAPGQRQPGAALTASPAAIRQYWQSRGDAGAGEENSPRTYLRRVGWSALLADAIARRGVPLDAAILEPGCNVGRNLAYLMYCGYRNLHGIDVNPLVGRAMRDFFPELATCVTLTTGAVEDVLTGFADRSFDVVFTLATLMCIAPDAEGVFDEMARVCRRLLCTLEFEGRDGPRHFGRDYARVFGRRGWREVESLAFRRAGADLTNLFELEPDYTLRVFER